jgi:hypothetical protein
VRVWQAWRALAASALPVRVPGYRITSLAGVFRPQMADHLEVARHVVQHFGHVLAHAAAAGRANTGAVACRLVQRLLAREVLGKLLGLRHYAHRFWHVGFIGFGAGLIFGLVRLQFLNRSSRCSIWRVMR